MPGVAQPGIVGSREDLSDEIFQVDAQETPYLSMIPKGSKPNGMVTQYQGDKPASVNKRGTVDGKPVGAAKSMSNKRRLIDTNVHWMRESVRVGKLAQEYSDVAGVENVWANEIDKALAAMSVGLDQVLCDDTGQRDQAGEIPSETAGFFDFVDTDGGSSSNRKVPAEYRPGAAQIYNGGTLAAFDEEDMGDIIEAMYLRTGQSGRIYGLFGIGLKRHVGTWGRYTPDKASNATVRQFNKDVDDRALCNVIDVLEMDGGTVEIHLSRNLHWDRDSNEDTPISRLTTESGMLFPDGHSQLRVGELPGFEPLPKDGGGENGMVDCLVAHQLFPYVCGKIVPTAS